MPRENASAKARRYLAEGRAAILEVSTATIAAAVRGDGPCTSRARFLGVHIHTIKDQNQQTDTKGAVPQLLGSHGYPVYTWDRDRFGSLVEKAAVKAGYRCLQHNEFYCTICG